MPTGTFEYHSEAERHAIEQAIAFVAEMHALARTAANGQVLQSCEEHALDAGRQLLQRTLQHAVQVRIDADEKKGRPHAVVPATAFSTSNDAAHAK
jgi:hypothetical protein